VAGLVKRRHRLGELAARLDSLSPLRVLERGYAVVSSTRDSRVVVDASTVEVGEDLQIRLLRGKLRARTVARET
jgi:exodeoxyribonuclease VII large subunit